MRIRDLDLNRKVLVVAEIGNNHEGDFAAAQKLVREAAACGVGAVKFQTFRTEHYVNRADEARFLRLKSFELGFDQFESLARLARSLGLLFLSTPFDLTSAEFLKDIVDAYKVASGDNNFYPLIQRVVASGKPTIISTGMCDLSQVKRTVNVVRRICGGNGLGKRLALLHCVASYPVTPDQAALESIGHLKRSFPDLTIGYSDHTVGIDAALLSVALGARIIEKHFTLDKNYSDFRDHKLSADPAEMRQLVDKVKTAELLIGDRKGKSIQLCEKPMIPLVRRAIAAGADLPRGHRLRMQDLTWLRPIGKLVPGQESRVLGRVLKRALRFGESIGPADVA